jgi:natural resistance-associated macrophage protein
VAHRRGVRPLSLDPRAHPHAQLGSVIMPHNIFLHSALVQSRKVDHACVAHVRQANLYNAVESALALGLSFLINACIVCCFAKGFFADACAVHGLACVPIDASMDAASAASPLIPCVSGVGPGVCDAVGLSVAGAALNRLLPGSSARLVWAIGLLAAGQSSTMTGTLAGQYVMEGFLSLRIERWKRTLLTRSLALGPAVTVALLCQANPSAGDTADEWLNVLQSVQLPFAVLPLVLLTNDPRIMGSFANTGWHRSALWALVLAIVAVNVYLVIISLVSTQAGREFRWSWVCSLGLVGGIGYFVFLFQLLERPAVGSRLGSQHASRIGSHRASVLHRAGVSGDDRGDDLGTAPPGARRPSSPALRRSSMPHVADEGAPAAYGNGS